MLFILLMWCFVPYISNGWFGWILYNIHLSNINIEMLYVIIWFTKLWNLGDVKFLKIICRYFCNNLKIFISLKFLGYMRLFKILRVWVMAWARRHFMAHIIVHKGHHQGLLLRILPMRSSPRDPSTRPSPQDPTSRPSP